MSWNGTVRCSWCYKAGHNKRSCPEYTELIKQRALEEINAGEGYDGYWSRMYNKRVKDGLYADGSPMSDEHLNAAKVRGGKVRRCTYCGSKGHNRRTCPTLVADKAAWTERNIAFRTRLVGAMKASGLGVGALVSLERWSDVHAWMITKINWHQVVEDGFQYRDLVLGQNLKTEGISHYNRTAWLRMPELLDENNEVLNESGHGTPKIVGPVVLAGVPADFLTEAGLAAMRDDHFDKDARSSNYWENYHGH